LNLQALALELPPGRHPNRLPFRGVLTVVDEPSDRAPSGARGHRVIVARAAAEAALPSLIGMALDYTPRFDGHDARRKVGIITGAEIVGKQLEVEGYVFSRDFPELASELKLQARGALGMSYELADAHIENTAAPLWKITKMTFTGAAVLLRDKAAYSSTWIKIEATGEKKKMEQQEMQEFVSTTERLARAAESLTATVERLEAQHGQLSARIEKIVATIDEQGPESEALRSRIAELEEQNATLKASLNAQSKENQPPASGRKTLPPLVSTLLAKNGVELPDELDSAALDSALGSLSVEQRIAVKAQMARAGLIR